ncbi:hypothetical protein HY639_02945 [Candidatus Woesearchaeota archaeon]|nr:hypothetical protein [Candidatus Woesearchaeota archaeon]
MEYVDEKGKMYEISYSQRLQREQNRLLRRKNTLLLCLLLMFALFGLGGLYVYVRLASIDLLTKIMVALSACTV